MSFKPVFYTVGFRDAILKYRQIKMNMAEDYFDDDIKIIGEIFIDLNTSKDGEHGFIHRTMLQYDVKEQDVKTAYEALAFLYSSIKFRVFATIPHLPEDMLYPSAMMAKGDLVVEFRRSADGTRVFSAENTSYSVVDPPLDERSSVGPFEF